MSFLAPIAGAVIGGAISARASGKASDAQQQSARESNELQKYMYDTNRADTAPYRAAGTDALSQIQALLKNPNSISNSADYKFGMSQGVNALENSATSRGMTYSGQQAKALQRYGNDYAGSKLGETYNRLASVAGLGQSGVNSSALAGGNYANQAGANMIGAGNAGAANALARGSAYGNAVNNAFGYAQHQGMFGGGGQSAFSQTPMGGSGFGAGMAYGNQDYGQFFG